MGGELGEKEAKHDRRLAATKAERLQRQREGEAARTRTASRDAIPPNACRSMPER
jgi:hypothetical protein